MAFLYERDHINRRVVVTFHGDFHKDEVLTILERHSMEDIGTHSVLYDLLGMTGPPTLAVPK